jgi:enoyl-CoA hydratase/carnithine racemase
MTDRQFVKLSLEDRVALITIDHPPVNALNVQTMLELESVVDEISADPNVKVAVITGGGQLAFVAGADINEFTKVNSAAEAKELINHGQRTFAKIATNAKPFIAAINGIALGGGMELAIACHLRIIGDRAKLGQPEINLGIIPGWGGTQRLARIVGRAKTIELVLTGDQITAQEAFRLNLVNKVVPSGEVLKTAKDLAKKIAAKGGVAIRAGMEAIMKGLHMQLTDGLAYEADQVSILIGTEDAREGISAFLQKRQPVFKDK